MEKNLTEGSVFKNIVFFSLPFLLSNFLQTLYGMADLFIAGQYNGSEVISAVSIGSQVMHMLTVIIIGLAMGGTVLLGQAVGAKNPKRAAKVIGNTTIIFVIFSVASLILLQLICRPLAKLIQTPAESLDQTVLYLRICFAGIPFIVAYNVIASIYRGMGDSKTPMLFIAFSCVLNILLDYLFMGVLGMKAGGAAIATVIAQTFSVIISLIPMLKSKSEIKLTKEDFKLEKSVSTGIMGIGVPVACQDGFIQVSFMIITAIANSRGVEVSAAVGIVEKIICFLFLIPSSMLSAISALAAQNIGACKLDRAKKTLFFGTAIAAGFGLFFAILFQFISEPVLLLFVKDEPKVVELGVQYLRAYVTDCFFAAFHFCFSGYFCAMGKSIISFMHNAISVVFFRIPGAYLASKIWPETLTPMGFAAPVGSAVSMLICVIAYLILRNKTPKFE